MQRCAHDKRSGRLPVRADRWVRLCPPPCGHSAGSMLTFRKVQLVSAAPLFKTFHGILTVSEGAFLPGLPWGTCLRAPFLRNDAASAQCPEHSQDEVSAFLPSFCLNNSFSGEAVPDLGLVPSRGFGLFVPRHAREAACLPWGRDRRPPRLIPVGPGPWREAPPAHGGHATQTRTREQGGVDLSFRASVKDAAGLVMWRCLRNHQIRTRRLLPRGGKRRRRTAATPR